MSLFNRNNYPQKKKKHEGVSKRSDSLSFKKISREQVSAAMEEYFMRGGKITVITEKDIMERRQEEIMFFGGDESFNFLNGD
jgi:hypothetical protein